MPHQSQGACMAIEDAAALGLLFSTPFFSAGDSSSVPAALSLYQQIRLPRATRVQAAAARAAGNINERIGFSANADTCATYSVASERDKLTVEEMNAYDMARDIEEKVALQRGQEYRGAFVGGLPRGLEMPNGVVVGA
jgi:salicylate hydroxylase